MVDSLGMYMAFENYSEFKDRPVYISWNGTAVTAPDFKFLQNQTLPCQTIAQSDLLYFGQQYDGQLQDEIDSRINAINQINESIIFFFGFLVMLFELITCSIPLLLDLILLICDKFCRFGLRDTQKTAFLRNILTYNWVIMEPLIMLTSIPNSISFEDCFSPSDMAFFSTNYIQYNGSIFCTLAVIETYLVLFFLVHQRNKFEVCFCIFLAFAILGLHAFVIYQASVGSKYWVYAIFTYKQWLQMFIIAKFQADFKYLQAIARDSRKACKERNRLEVK